jgi:prolipoprotein diacylglyceryltransferase
LSLTYYQKEKERTRETMVVEQTIYPHEYVGEMTFIAGVAGMSGARLFHYLENIEQLIADPMGSLLSTGGFSIYGGLIIGGIAVLWYVYRKGLSPTHVADASAPALMLAYGVGRIGCHISGDGDWGLPNDAPIPAYLGFLPEWIWAYSYPNNVLGIDLQKDFTNMGLESLTGKAWPTPLYEAIASILLFICLWSIRNRVKAPGVMFSIYLILNGLERFLIEKIRINPPYSFWGIEATQAELISITFMMGGIFGVLYLSRLQRYSRLSKEGSLK